MKKFKSLFLVAAALMIGFASCNNSDEYTPTPGGPFIPDGSALRLNFSMGTGTRAVGPSQGEVPVTVNGGIVFLTDNVGAIVAAELVGAAAAPDWDMNVPYILGTPGTTVTNRTQVTFENISATVAAAHFIGNTNILYLLSPSGDPAITLSEFRTRNLAQVAAVYNAVETQVVANNAVNVWGTSLRSTWTAVGTSASTDNELFAAEIWVNPTLARVELFNITGNQNIAGFTVEGVFIDSYYAEGSVNFGGREWTVRGADDHAVRGARFQPLANGGMFAPEIENAIFDWHGFAADGAGLESALMPADLNGTITQLHRVVAPGATNTDGPIWGYNLFAGTGAFALPTGTHPTENVGRTIGGTRTPRIAIRLADVQVYKTMEWDWVYTITPAVVENGVIITPAVTEDRSMTARVLLPHAENREDPTTPWVVPNNIAIGTTLGTVVGNNLLNIWYAIADPVARLTAIQAHFDDKYDTNDVALFISIRGFLHGGEPLDANDRPIPNLETGFIPRMVYQLGSYRDAAGGSSWTFGPENVTRVPFEEDIDVEVTVIVQSWVHVGVDPIL